MATLTHHELLHDGMLGGHPPPAVYHPPVPMTDDELMAFSRSSRPYRVERNAEGELEIMSPVGHDGGHREQYVGGELYLWAKEHGGRTFSSSTGFKLADSSVRSPDASWMSEQREGVLTAMERRGFAPVCPDFLIEILSETDSRVELEAKMAMWLANGARLAWMIDPYEATVRVFQPGCAVKVLDRPDVIKADGVVPGFRLVMAGVWDV